MSLQGYLDTIKKKTGKTPEDFRKLAEEKGLLNGELKAGSIVAWLKKDFDLGRGHSMAIYMVFKEAGSPKLTQEESVDHYFTGVKAGWRKAFDDLVRKIRKLGTDISVSAGGSYVTIARSGKKIAIVQARKEWMDLGIKVKGKKATGRFEDATEWNATVTHRVRFHHAGEIDQEVMEWLKQAYEENGR